MQVKETLSDNLKREYDVTIPNSTIEEKMNSKLAAIGKTAKIKGFRKGKVPLEVIQKQYGNSVKGEVLEQVVNETSKAALEQQKITPAGPPKIEITEFKDGKDLSYSMSVELFPDVPKIDYEKITIEKLEIEPSDEDVDNSLKSVVAQSKQWKPVEDGSAVEIGNTVTIDFEGFIDDVAFDGGKGEGFKLEIGSNQFIPGFEEQLIGAKAGDDVTVNVAFPEEYHSADLAGKASRFEVKVHEVLEAKEAELTDEFAKEFGVENIEQLRGKMREQLENDQAKYVHFKMKEALFDQIHNDYTFDLPESMVDIEFKTIWDQLEQEKAQGKPTDLDTKSEDDVKEEYMVIAKRRVALGIILSTISKNENVEVTQEDVVDAINAKAAQFPGQEEQVTDFYQKNPQMVQELAGPILEDKVVEHLLKKVTVKTKKTSMKELLETEEKATKKKEDKK